MCGFRRAKIVWDPVTSGVPLGSVLGPNLFLLYINVLPENINLQVRLFADEIGTSKDDSQTLQQDLQKLDRWEKTWEMHFNQSKCQVLHITPARNPLQTQYVLHGQVWGQQTMQSTLDWKSVMTWTGTNIYKMWPQKQIGPWASYEEIFKPSIKAYVKQLSTQVTVKPQVEYASPVWSLIPGPT